MIPKKNRADKKTIESIFKSGKTLNSPCLSFRFILAGDTVLPRVSFIAPKSISKKAVERNLLRRRGYAALSKHILLFPAGIVGAFVFKRYQDDISILENEIKSIIDKLH